MSKLSLTQPWNREAVGAQGILGRPAPGGRMVAVKLNWPLAFTDALAVLNVTTGLA